MTPEQVVLEIEELFQLRGSSQYGHEVVTQLEHGLQAAMLAEQEQASPALVTAALLHDVGHLLHDLSEDAPDAGVDDRHERRGYAWLNRRFSREVTDLVLMHVEAKRYLCAVDSDYRASLSGPSETSLRLQGGPMSQDEADQFERHPQFAECVRLRRWDDRAKEAGLATPPLRHFLESVRTAVSVSAKFRVTSGNDSA